jgi:hypothetical protein
LSLVLRNLAITWWIEIEGKTEKWPLEIFTDSDQFAWCAIFGMYEMRGIDKCRYVDYAMVFELGIMHVMHVQ